MTPWRWLVLVCLALLGVMNLVAPAGLPDTLVLGYDTAHLDEFAKDSKAVARAAGLSFWLDMVFPGLLTLALVWPLRGLWRGPALAYGAFDYIENLVLHRFYLTGGAAPDLAPMLSRGKWVCVALALVVLGFELWRKRRVP